MNSCCSIPNQTQSKNLTLCSECKAKGKNVERRTVLHHVKSDQLWRVSEHDFWFCSTPDCAVVYYDISGESFTIDDMRELITAKTTGDARPLCYCFGFTESEVRRELMLKGETIIPGQISRFIKNKQCACEIRNPSGACCLGEVIQAVKKLTKECKVAFDSQFAVTRDCCSY